MTIVMLASVSTGGQETEAVEQIKEALMPLPEPLKPGATVVLDTVPGKRVILRKGTNGLVCRANTSKTMFEVRCHTKELDAFYKRFAELALAGKPNSEYTGHCELRSSVGETQQATSRSDGLRNEW